MARISVGFKSLSLPIFFDLAPLALVSGRGAGVRGLHCVLIWFLIVNSMSILVA